MIESQGGKCADCGGVTSTLDVHHKTYRHLGRERMSDLVGLCRVCHEALHGRKFKEKPSIVTNADGFRITKLPPGPMPMDNHVIRMKSQSLVVRSQGKARKVRKLRSM